MGWTTEELWLDFWLGKGKIFLLQNVQCGPAAHPGSNLIGARGWRQLECKFDHSSPSSFEVKNECCYTSDLPTIPSHCAEGQLYYFPCTILFLKGKCIEEF